MDDSNRGDVPSPVSLLTREQEKALTAQAFCLEVNATLERLNALANVEKINVPVLCAAMLIFCRNASGIGTPIRHSLETMLRKNFPFMKLEVAPPKGARN